MWTRTEFLGALAAGATGFSERLRGSGTPAQIKAFCVDFNWLFDKQDGWPNTFARPGHWADASPREHVEWYRKLGANVLQTFALSCNGYAWYKNGVIPPQPGLRHDFLTQTVRLGHDKGMTVVGYFCAAANTKWAMDHPDLSYGTPSNQHIPFTDAYLDYLARAIEDALRRTSMDGFMIDWVWNPNKALRKDGWIASEKKLFTQLTGKPFPKAGAPSDGDVLTYERAAIDRCWRRIREAAKGAKPDCIIWLSCSRLDDPTVANSPMLREVDWLMNESYRADLLEPARRMKGAHTRLLQCLVGWKEHDAKSFLADPRHAKLDLYGFAIPGSNSLPLPIEDYLSKPIEAFPGEDRVSANHRNISTLARFYNGLALDKIVPRGKA